VVENERYKAVSFNKGSVKRCQALQFYFFKRPVLPSNSPAASKVSPGGRNFFGLSPVLRVVIQIIVGKNCCDFWKLGKGECIFAPAF
jgi:hypothetical protein